MRPKQNRLITIMAPMAMILAGAGCQNAGSHAESGEEETAAVHEEHGEPEGHEGHNHGEGKEIVLSPEQAKMFGVKTEQATAGTFGNVIKASGEIMPSQEGTGVASAPTSGIISFAKGIETGAKVGAGALIGTIRADRVSGGDANASARVALEAAKKELDRITPLHEHGIVSTADYNAAVSAYETAKANYSPSASSGRVTSPTSGTIQELLVKQGQFVETGTPVATIGGSRMLTLRADVAQRHYASASKIRTARIKLPYTQETIDLEELGGRRTDAETATAQGGYFPVYFTLNNDGRLMAGTAVEVYLETGQRENVISVPWTAIYEQQGTYFVYIKIDDEGYIKSPVKLGESDGTRVEITSGVHEGDIVVTEGKTAVRLAETSGAVPEGHSHSH